LCCNLNVIHQAVVVISYVIHQAVAVVIFNVIHQAVVVIAECPFSVVKFTGHSWKAAETKFFFQVANLQNILFFSRYKNG